MNRTLWHAGVVFVVLGVMLAVVPTGSYSSIAGERSVDVFVAADDSALVALQETGSVVDSTQQGTRIADVTNNIQSTADISYTVTAASDSVTGTNGSVSLASGGSQALYAKCTTPPTGGSGTTQVTVTVDATTANQQTTVSDATFAFTVNVNCPGGGGGKPGQAPTGSDAYVDANGNGQYDPGETTWTVSELSGFDNDSADLVVNTGGETRSIDGIDVTAESVTIVDTTLDGQNSDISISADTVTLTDTTFDVQNGDISISADTVTVDGTDFNGQNGDMSFTAESITMTGATLDSKNAQLSLTSTSGAIDVTGSTLLTKKSVTIDAAGDLHANQTVMDAEGDISLAAGGDVFVRQAQLSAGNGNTAVTADLGSTASTLDVTDVQITDKDDTLVYGPSGVTVVGTPTSGQVSN